MPYIDGFVVPVPRDKLPAYLKLAKLASKVWKEHGALEYVECVGDDVPVGRTTSFPRSVKLKDEEIVIFSYIVYTSRRHRDQVMKKVMADDRMASSMNPKTLPFDARRMIFGGFKTVISV